ncbi:hypothetical protein [uncultured Tenacibaculum sp.]|uniref:hypothetical protein n=1 Tax=uncultured Tenacibaculum sp. TaxID=174713 RepID=UPI0026138018|nr:hypothetical protein [uncultured Tenacibaculum sp.]
MKTSIDILKTWFQTGDKPTENQFENLIDSFHHKDEGNIITSYQIFDNGDVSFTLSDGKTALIEKFVLPNTMPQNFIDGLVETLNSKVNKVTGKQLSDENFSLELKQKLENLENYVHPEFHKITEVEGLQEAIENKVDIIEGKQLSDENFSTEEKEKLSDLKNYVAPESQPISYIEELEESLTKINQDLNNKIDIVEGKQLSDENFTSEEKEKLANFNISTFATVSDGTNIISANGQADQLVFDGATIDVDKNIVVIDQPEIPTSFPISSIENLEEELTSITQSIDEKVSNEDLQAELTTINNDLDTKIDEGGLEPIVQNLENQISERISGTEFHDELDQIKLEIDNKLDESQVDDKLVEIKSDLSNKVDKVTGKQLSTNDFTTAEKQKLAELGNQSIKIYKDSKSVFYDPEELQAGKIDLLDQSFIAYELLRDFNTIKLNSTLRCYIPDNVEITQKSFNFSVELGLIRNLNFAYPLFNISVINFEPSKLVYLNDIVLTTDIVTHNANGVRFITQNIEIDCAKPLQTAYSKTETYPRTYFDYPLSETPNKIDNNKLLLNFTNSPFRIWTQASVVMVY